METYMVYVILALVVVFLALGYYITSIRSDMFSLFDYPVSYELPDGSVATFINFDNAASTLPMRDSFGVLNRYACYYSNVHRGSGSSSQLSTVCFEKTRDHIINFVGGSADKYFCAYGKNATEALNMLAQLMKKIASETRKTILITEMEHHSNDLPFRKVHYENGLDLDVIHVREDGTLDMSDLREKIKTYKDSLLLCSVTGASNVTGIRPPIKEIGELVHGVGGYFAADGSQLVPHTKVNITDLDLDFLVFSAHKIYAPFGIGVLIGKQSILDMLGRSSPAMLVGGGNPDLVPPFDSKDSFDGKEGGILWKDGVENLESGTPNVLGALALSTTLVKLENIGMEKLEKDEQELYRYAVKRLSTLPIKLYVPSDGSATVGILTFTALNEDDYPYNLISAALGYEYSIGCRSGCFCAHPYVAKLLGRSPENMRNVRTALAAGDRSIIPGLVRISFAMYNTKDEIDSLYEALKTILSGHFKYKYTFDKAKGEYLPEGVDVDKCLCRRYQSMMESFFG